MEPHDGPGVLVHQAQHGDGLVLLRKEPDADSAGATTGEGAWERGGCGGKESSLVYPDLEGNVVLVRTRVARLVSSLHARSLAALCAGKERCVYPYVVGSADNSCLALLP